MSKRSAIESFFETVSTINVDIMKHALREEVSDLYFNNHAEDMEHDYDVYLGKFYKNFVNEVDTQLDSTSQPALQLKKLKRQIEDVQTYHQSSIQSGLKKINSFEYVVPTSNIDFFNRMANLQTGYISKAFNYIQLPLADLETEEEAVTNSADLKLEFNLQRNEVVALFLLLESAGFIKKVSEKDVRRFMEKHVMFTKNNEYKPIQGLSSLLSQIKDYNAAKPDIVERLKEKINNASIDMR